MARLTQLFVRLARTIASRRSGSALLVAMLSLGSVGGVHAVEAPANIRLEDGVLRWDPVADAVNYNIYFLTGPVVNNTVSPQYAGTVDSTLEFQPTMDGFYTVVTVAAVDGDLEFSNVADGATVEVTGVGPGPAVLTINNVLQILTERCDNVVAGGVCESQCPLASRINPTGGACRADAGVVLHHRATRNGYECISQNDTSFVEADVYCLRTSRIF